MIFLAKKYNDILCPTCKFLKLFPSEFEKKTLLELKNKSQDPNEQPKKREECEDRIIGGLGMRNYRSFVFWCQKDDANCVLTASVVKSEETPLPVVLYIMAERMANCRDLIPDASYETLRDWVLGYLDLETEFQYR